MGIVDVTNPDTLRDELNALHAVDGNTWRNIASFEKFLGVPAGTLCGFAKGHAMPRKYCTRFNLPALAPARVCPIHGIVETFDCVTQAVYTPATHALISLADAPINGSETKVSKPRKPYTRRPHYEFDKVTVARAEIGWAI